MLKQLWSKNLTQFCKEIIYAMLDILIYEVLYSALSS